MKRILSILVFIISFKLSFSQFPITGTLGAPSTTILTKGVHAVDSALQFRTNYTDTTQANLGRIDELPGVVIRTGTSLWVRNQATTAWAQISGTNIYWSTTGNASTVDGTNFIGTTDDIPFNIRVNNQRAGRVTSTGTTMFGYTAGNTGNFNSGIGFEALKVNTGSSNTAIGYQSMAANTSGSNNTALGIQSLLNSTLGESNTAIGAAALTSLNSDVDYNTAIGAQSLLSMTGGSGLNTAAGALSMRLTTTGHYNSAFGYRALASNTTGGLNTAIGMNAMQFSTTGDKNTGVGVGALENNTTGSHNTAVGFDALLYNTRGHYNVGIGWNALQNSDSASYNIGIGHRPGNSLTDSAGEYNIFIGYDAGNNVSQKVDAANSIAIGKLAYTTASNQIVIGTTTHTETNLFGNLKVNTLDTDASAPTTSGTTKVLVSDANGLVSFIDGSSIGQRFGVSGEDNNNSSGTRSMDMSRSTFTLDSVNTFNLRSYDLTNSSSFIQQINQATDDWTMTYTGTDYTGRFRIDNVPSASLALSMEANKIGSSSYGSIFFSLDAEDSLLHASGDKIHLETDSTTRPESGIFIPRISYSTSGVLQSILRDSITGKLYRGQGGSTTPTLQQVLTAGSTLTQNNTIVNGANTLTSTFDAITATGFNITSSSTAAASNQQALLNVTLTGANANSNQTTKAIYAVNVHSGTGSQNYAVYGQATGGNVNTGVYGNGSTYGVQGVGTTYGGYFTASGAGVVGSGSSGGTGVVAFATAGGLAFSGNLSDTSINTVIPIMTLIRQSTGTPANGIGQSIDFYLQTDNVNNTKISNRLISKYTAAADLARTSQFDITGVNTGSTEIFANFQTGGIVRVNNLADTLATKAYARSVGGGGGGTPAGNFGNLQIMRNGLFATPASDSLDFESATGLSVLGNINTDRQFKVTNTSLGTTQDDDKGVLLTNTTAASAGVQQISPAINWTGQGWKTDATAASQSVEFRAYNLPVQGAAAPTGTWKLQSSINGGAYSDRFSITSDGAATLTSATSGEFTISSSDASGLNVISISRGGNYAPISFTTNGTNALVITGSTFGNTYNSPSNAGHYFQQNGTSKLYIATAGVKVGDANTPTASLHIVAQSTAAGSAPLKFISAEDKLATAEAGAFEYSTPQLFFTNGAAVRQELFQGTHSRATAQFDKTSSTTLSNITGLTANVAAGKTYRFEARLYTTSNSAGGVKFAISGTATATAIVYEGLTIDAGVITQSRGAALGAAVGAVTAVTAAYTVITGTITVNAAGTLTVQFAQNASSGSTSSVLVGSTFVVIEIV